MNISPDSEDILKAISVINGGASIVPEDLDAAVSHAISSLGKDSIQACVGKSPKEKRMFLIGFSFAVAMIK